MKPIDESNCDEFDQEAIKRLKSDNRCWKWDLSDDKYEEYLLAYKGIGKTVGDLACAMGYSELDTNNATGNFLRVRKGKINTNGWAIYNLACEFSSACGFEISPFEIAKPDKIKCKHASASEAAMNRLWNQSEYTERLDNSIPAIQIALRKQGITSNRQRIRHMFLMDERNHLRKVLGTFLFLVNWLRSKTSNAAIAGVFVVTGLVVFIKLLPTSCNHPPEDRQGSSSHQSENSNVSISGMTSTNDKNQDDSNSSNEASVSMVEKHEIRDAKEGGNDVDKENLTIVDKADEREDVKLKTETFQLIVGVNVPEGGFTINNKNTSSYKYSRKGSQCGLDGDYYICYFGNLPSGEYEVKFSDLVGYRTPKNKYIERGSEVQTAVGYYVSTDSRKAPSSGNIHVGVNLQQGGFMLTSDETEKLMGTPLYLFKRRGGECKTIDDNGYFTCHFPELPFGGYTVQYSDVDNYRTPSDQGILLESKANIKEEKGRYLPAF